MAKMRLSSRRRRVKISDELYIKITHLLAIMRILDYRPLQQPDREGGRGHRIYALPHGRATAAVSQAFAAHTNYSNGEKR